MGTKETMKLISWNVARKVEEVSQQLEKILGQNIDILALQEMAPSTVQSIRNGLAEIGLKYVETSHQLDGPHQYGILIASRWPFTVIPEFFEKIPWQKSVLSAIIEKTPYGEIEVQAVHVPPASSNSRKIKVETFNSIYDALAKPSQRHRILCGDFNSPKKEKKKSSERNTYWGTKSEHRRSEKQVIEGLKEHDLEDTYRKLHPDYSDGAYSHVNRNPNTPNRRYDHIFSSTSLNPIECDYLHPFLDLSDHSPVYAIYEPETS